MEKQNELLSRAANEIKHARRRIELMGAKLEMFDNCMLLLKAKTPDVGMSHAPDLVHEIETFLKC